MAIVRVAMLPSLLTLGNFTCGFFAIVLCMHAVLNHTRAEGMRAELRRNAPAPATAAPTEGTDADGPAPTPDAAAPDPAAHARARLSAEASKLAERAGDLMQYACLFIFLGMFFDTLDGRVARMTGTDSRFGAELDSLADASSFGLAPAAIVTATWILAMPEGKSWWGQVMLFGAGYAACAALRLARYNVEIGSNDRNYFHGLPSPGAAGCVAATALFLGQGWPWLDTAGARVAAWTGAASGADVQARALGVYTLLVGFLMVTRLRFVHVPNKYLSGRRKFTSLVLCVFLAVLLVNWPWPVLCVAFNGYVLLCLAENLWGAGRRGREAAAANRGT